MSFTMKQRRSLRAVVLSVMVLTLAQFCFLGEAKKKFQKCPLHAKKVSIAITKLKSQQECRFLSVLVPVKDEDVPALADALAENTVSPTSPSLPHFPSFPFPYPLPPCEPCLTLTLVSRLIFERRASSRFFLAQNASYRIMASKR